MGNQYMAVHVYGLGSPVLRGIHHYNQVDGVEWIVDIGPLALHLPEEVALELAERLTAGITARRAPEEKEKTK